MPMPKAHNVRQRRDSSLGFPVPPPPWSMRGSFQGMIEDDRAEEDAIETPKGEEEEVPEMRIRRRQGITSSVISPTGLKKTLSVNQRDQRMVAFLNTIGYPLDQTTIATWLTKENWNVPLAAAAWRKDKEKSLKDSGAKMMTVCDTRFQVLTKLFAQLKRKNHDAARHSMVTAMALLRRHRWILEAALVEYQDLNGDLSKYANQMEVLRSQNPTQMQQDQRLAEFLTWTSMDSWFAAHEFLRSNNWDFVRAVENFSRRHGKLPPVRVSKVTRTGIVIGNGGMRSVSVQYGSDNARLDFFADVRPVPAEFSEPIDGGRDKSGFPFIRTPQPPNTSPRLDYAKGSKPRAGNRVGWIIDDFIGSCAYEGCPDPTKLRIEYIANGSYSCKWAYGQTRKRDQNGRRIQRSLPIRWEDSDVENERGSNSGNKRRNKVKLEDMVEMDWSNPAHVTAITNFRGQTLRRITGQTSETCTIRWEEAESDFLFQLHAELLEEYLSQNKRTDTSHSNFMPLSVNSMRQLQWVKRFNDLFEGKSTVQIDDKLYDFDTPRPVRSWHSLDCRSRRDAKIADAFFTGQHPIGQYRTKFLSNERVDPEDME